MSTTTPKAREDLEVKPGDLITAELMNLLIERIEQLEANQTSGALPVIENVYSGDQGPSMVIDPSGPVHIEGENLDGVLLVRLDSKPQGVQSDGRGGVVIPKPDPPQDRSPAGLALISVSTKSGTGTRIVAYQDAPIRGIRP